MADFMLLMHGDCGPVTGDWSTYLAKLRTAGAFEGGSAIGSGASYRKSGSPGAVAGQLTGFIRVTATSLREAEALLVGNPVYEAGGTIEIRELPRS